ncbi:MAG TPA: response regulator [Anaerolineae bacterium]|nr:response regulator [Anaerolineae bacterium]
MTGQKVLVVDDDRGILRLVNLILSRAGYQVLMASTGETGIEMVRTENPDLILMDVMLPGMDGFQATKLIRRLPNGRLIPIIFVSAMDDVEAKMKGLRGGATDYVTKPVRAGELLARIEAHLRPGSAVSGQLVTVFGGKSGVGTTTVVVNLALALRQLSQKNVLIVDYQRPLGDVASLLSLPETPAVDLLLAHTHELDDELFASVMQEYTPGVSVIIGALDPASTRQVNKRTLIEVLKIGLTMSDYVLVDAGAFFSWADPPLSAKDEGLNLCVLTPDPIGIKRAVQVTQTAATTGHDLWPILNRYRIAEDIPQEQVASQLGINVKGAIPDETDLMRRALNAGRPVYQDGSAPDFNRAMDDIANIIVGSL